MSSEETNNNLDDFFRSRLSEQGDEAWNLPSDRVFEAAMAQIDQRRKRRWFFWLILLGLSLGIAGFVYWSLDTIQGLEHEVSQLKQAQIEIPEDALSIGGDSPVQESASSAMDEQGAITSSTSKPITKDIVSNLDIETKLPVYSQTPSSTYILTTEADRSTTSLQEITNDIEPAENGHFANSIEDDPPLKTKLVDAIPSPALSAKPVKANDKVVGGSDSSSSKSQSRLYLIAGSNWSSLSMTANDPLPENLKEYDNWYLGYQYGLGLSRVKGHVTYFAELSLSQTVNRSVFKDQAVYSKQNEFMNSNGDPIYATDLDFDSPVLPFSQEVSFEASGKNLNEGDTMDSKMSIENTFHLISLDVGLQYSIWSKGKSRISALASAGLNVISELEQDVHLDLYRSESLIGQERSDLNTTSLYNRWVPSVQLGLSYQYQFKDFELSFRTTYGSSLRSIREVDPNTQVKTQMQLIRTNLALAYRL